MTSANKDVPDPGWNDPPLFSYDKATSIQQTAAGKRGPALNKRVAFPMTGNIARKETIDPTLPPSADAVKVGTPPQSSFKPPAEPTVCEENAPAELASDDRLSKVLKNLDAENCDEQIRKRIKVMEKLWLEDKLHVDVQARLFQLSEAISSGDRQTADHIQKSLMVDYASQCSSWMSAIRHIINQEPSQDQQL